MRFRITGGNESLGPPVGGTILAQPVPDEMMKMPIITTARADNKKLTFIYVIV